MDTLKKPRAKNLFGRTAKIDAPYATYTNNSGWTWLVLKTYQTPEKEKGNLYARWFLAVRSPFTYGSYEMGDTYITDVVTQAVLVSGTPDWLAAYSRDD